MRKEDFFEVLGELDDDIVKGAETPIKKKRRWMVLGAMAACMALIVSATLYFHDRSIERYVIGITKDHVEEVQIQIDCWQSDGFVGTIVVGNDIFSKDENVIVIFNKNVTVIQQDGRNFEFDTKNPNAESCNYAVGSLVWVGFQAYEHTKATGSKYNRIFAYHIDSNER